MPLQPQLICHLVSNHSPSQEFNPVTGDSGSVTPSSDVAASRTAVRGCACADPHLIPAKVAFSRRHRCVRVPERTSLPYTRPAGGMLTVTCTGPALLLPGALPLRIR